MSNLGFEWVEWPYARIRRELDTEEGWVTRFVFQLEYNMRATQDGLPPHDWRQVARFDHNVDGEHNIEVEGLHLDLYRDGEKYEKLWGFPEMTANQAPDFCQEFLEERADELLDEFEEWHDVGREWR